jgi:hypothetical protein
VGNLTLCRRCGRRLKRPESIQRGYGSSCWRKVNGFPSLRVSKRLRSFGLPKRKPVYRKTLLEVFGPSTTEAVTSRLEDVEPVLAAIATEAERIHRKARKRH